MIDRDVIISVILATALLVSIFAILVLAYEWPA